MQEVKEPTGIYYLEIGPQGSNIIRHPKTGRKCLQQNEDIIEMKIPKWSNDSNLKFVNTLDELPSDIPLAIHLGKSKLIALDFDDDTFNTALDINNKCDVKCHNISRSLGKVGGHFLFKYNDNELTKYIGNPNGKKAHKLDCLYGNTLLYYDTEANLTKETIQRGELTECPLLMQYFVIAHYGKEPVVITTNYNQEVKTEGFSTKIGYYLEKLYLFQQQSVSQADSNNYNIVMSHLMRIITPARYKTIMDNNKRLSQLSYPIDYHPDYLPETESAHMYVLALSGVLTVDTSVSQERHAWFINLLNGMFSKPLDIVRVNSILTRDFQSPKYQYNQDWNKVGYTKYNKKQELIEIFCYTDKNAINFLVYNHVTQEVTFLNASSITDYLLLECSISMKRQELLPLLQNIKIISRPDKPFGYVDGKFNFYKWSDEQQVFYSPEQYQLTWSSQELSQKYDEYHPRYPIVTLRALQNACGDKLEMFLQFMKRKYTYREYSPLIFVFFGVPHSFKSAVINGVFSKLSYNRTRNMTYDAVLEKYDGWKVNTDLVLIDEVHYIVHKEQQKLIKTINEISGNAVISSVRRMYQDFSDEVYPNELTFFLATNEQIALSNEIKDRRLVIFKSAQRVSDALNMSDIDIKKHIQEESLNFAYYLAKYVSLLNDTDFQSNERWKDEVYQVFQEVAHNIEDRLLYALEYNNMDSFIELLLSVGVTIPKMKQCIEYSAKLKMYYFRLFNTNEQFASIPSLFNNLQVIDVGKIKKKLYAIKSAKIYQTDYVNGQRISTSRKTVVLIGQELPELLAGAAEVANGIEL